MSSQKPPVSLADLARAQKAERDADQAAAAERSESIRTMGVKMAAKWQSISQDLATIIQANNKILEDTGTSLGIKLDKTQALGVIGVATITVKRQGVKINFQTYRLEVRKGGRISLDKVLAHGQNIETEILDADDVDAAFLQASLHSFLEKALTT